MNNRHKHTTMTPEKHPFPRIRDLPEHEQQAFKSYLIGQTRPLVEGLPQEEQDFFYACDYRRWKAGLPNELFSR